MAEENVTSANKIADATLQSVSFFILTNDVFKQIKTESDQASDKATNIVTLFKQFVGDTPGDKLEKITQEAKLKQEQAVAVTKESISATKNNNIDIAKLALILPLLLNDEARKYLASFLQGLIGIESLEKIQTTLKLVGVVLATVFAVKVFKQVAETFNKFLRLTRLVGALFLLSEATGDLGEKEKRKADRRREAEKKRREKSSKNRRKKIERIRKLKKIKDVLSKGLIVGGPVAILGGLLLSITSDTLLNFILGEEEKDADADDKFDKELDDDDERTDVPEISDELDQKSLTDALIESARKAILEQLTLGLITEDSLRTSARALQGDEQAIERNQAAIRGAVSELDVILPSILPSQAPAAEPAPLPGSLFEAETGDLGFLGQGYEGPVTRPVAAPLPGSLLEAETGNLDFLGQGYEPRPKPVPIYSSPGFSLNFIPEPATSTNGTKLTTDSESVVGAKKEISSTTNVNNVIDNSIVITSPAERKNLGESTNYSGSVGR